MDAKTLKALKGSIKKWKKIERSTRCLDKQAQNCSLCLLVGLKMGRYNCESCLIYKKTEERGCFGTPYEDWQDHQNVNHEEFKWYHRAKDCPTCLDLATKEREFLESLLPKDNA